MRLRFLGATRQVTGSSYLLEVGNLRLLIDCGLFQERKFIGHNWAPFAIEPRSIDVLLLTHGHLDHCGLIPRLVQQGFRGRIIATAPSVELAAIVMRDSARIQAEDVAYKRKRHRRESRRGAHPYVPLYSPEDAEQAVGQLEPVSYGQTMELDPRVCVRYHEAGHILGSAMLELEVRGEKEKRCVLFSGDIGQWDKPLIGDPSIFDEADYIVMESTYGDRDHREDGGVEDGLAEAVSETVQAGGNLLIPTFAIERAQELLFHLSRLRRQKRIGRLPVFLDSPMAINVTNLFSRYRDYLDAETKQILAHGSDPLDFPGLHLCRRVEQSKAINAIHGTAVIMAGSGMCTGGRIKHHLIANIERPQSTILFVGYQSPDTLGGKIVRGESQVRIHGRMRAVRARVQRLYGLSAHADQTDLQRWLGAVKRPPKHLFLTHGEEQTALRFAENVRRHHGWPVTVPTYQQQVNLD